ncbi:hypothetical protein GCM10023215_58330 [Pseudonocardia yuanmonensis]|uniref:Transposase n=1 Tax=Pseudonocardia yuanmonensis TaxID=1095914 RepID=A0ABP8XKC1_9PSEU
MSGAYEGRQFVGMDLHRRRSVLVRMTEAGERLETVRISIDREYLQRVMARAGEAPEVVLEATYGWYWMGLALSAGRNKSNLGVGGISVRDPSVTRVIKRMLSRQCGAHELCCRFPGSATAPA